MALPGDQHHTPEELRQYWSATWTLPEVDSELMINETARFICVEIVNYETGVVLAHIDLYKDNDS
jgi:hypothetical protein